MKFKKGRDNSRVHANRKGVPPKKQAKRRKRFKGWNAFRGNYQEHPVPADQPYRP